MKPELHCICTEGAGFAPDFSESLVILKVAMALDNITLYLMHRLFFTLCLKLEEVEEVEKNRYIRNIVRRRPTVKHLQCSRLVINPGTPSVQSGTDLVKFQRAAPKSVSWQGLRAGCKSCNSLPGAPTYNTCTLFGFRSIIKGLSKMCYWDGGDSNRERNSSMWPIDNISIEHLEMSPNISSKNLDIKGETPLFGG